MFLGLECLLFAAAAWLTASWMAQNRPSSERLLAFGSLFASSILWVSYAAALLDRFRLPWVLALSTALQGALVLLARRRLSAGDTGRLLRLDLTSPLRVWASARAGGDLLSLLPFLAGGCALALSAMQVLYFPNWSWDVVWYHKPMTNVLVQTGSLDAVPTNIPFLNHFPKHTEVLSAWTVLLSGSTRLDDLPQLLLGMLGALAVAALARRMGAALHVSAGAGAVWLTLPSVALQLHTTHADVAGAAFFLVGFYFLTQPEFLPLDRWMSYLLFGLYAGTKGTGLFHLALLSPVLLWRVWRSGHGRPFPGRALEALGLAGVTAFPGLGVYARNVLDTGNPYWPLRVPLPLGSGELPGLYTPEELGNSPPAFFGFQLEGVLKMMRLWFSTQGEFYPDIREFPFGHVFPYLLLPALAGLWVFGWRRREAVITAALVLVSVLVPAAWWGRFVLAVPAAGLCAYAWGYESIRWRAARVLLSTVLTLLVALSFQGMWKGYRAVPTVGFSEETQRENELKIRTAITWLWPARLAQVREERMKPGDLLVFDEKATFTGEFWTEDVRNRVEYLPQEGQAAEKWVDEALKKKARWWVVGLDSPVHRLLRSQPDRFFSWGSLPRQETALFEVKSRNGP